MTKQPSTPEQATKTMHDAYTKGLKPAPKDKAGSIKVTNKPKGLAPKDSIASLRNKVESLTDDNVRQGHEIRSLKASVNSYKGANTKLRSGVDNQHKSVAEMFDMKNEAQDALIDVKKALKKAEHIIGIRDEQLENLRAINKLAFALSGLLLTVIIVGGIANGMGYIL